MVAKQMNIIQCFYCRLPCSCSLACCHGYTAQKLKMFRRFPNTRFSSKQISSFSELTILSMYFVCSRSLLWFFLLLYEWDKWSTCLLCSRIYRISQFSPDDFWLWFLFFSVCHLHENIFQYVSLNFNIWCGSLYQLASLISFQLTNNF